MTQKEAVKSVDYLRSPTYRSEKKKGDYKMQNVRLFQGDILHFRRGLICTVELQFDGFRWLVYSPFFNLVRRRTGVRRYNDLLLQVLRGLTGQEKLNAIQFFLSFQTPSLATCPLTMSNQQSLLTKKVARHFDIALQLLK